MKTIVVSDFHIWNDDRLLQIETFFEAMWRERPNVLILNGDIGDPWKATWNDIRKTQSWSNLGLFCFSRKAQGLLNYYIPFNHDSNFKSDYLPYVTVVNSLEVDEVEVRHGWEFDVAWRGIWGIPGISSVAFWIAKNHPSLMVPIYKWLYKNNTPSALKNTDPDKYTLGVAWIHQEATKYAQQKKVKLIIGHTHYPMNFDGVLADDGDMEDSFTYIRIENGNIELAHLTS